MYVVVWYLPGLGFYKILFLFFYWKISTQLVFVCLVKTLTFNAGKCNLVNREKALSFNITFLWIELDQVGLASIAKVMEARWNWSQLSLSGDCLRAARKLSGKLQSQYSDYHHITLVG